MDGRAPPTVSSFWPSLEIFDCDIVSLLRIVKVTGDKIQVRAKIAPGEISAGAVNEIDFHTYSVERVVKRPQDTFISNAQSPTESEGPKGGQSLIARAFFLLL
jgi:hypothetical protein